MRRSHPAAASCAIAYCAVLVASTLIPSRAATSTDDDCLSLINEAVVLADRLPQSSGREVVLRDIARARDARHENDQQECKDQVNETLALLRSQPSGQASAAAPSASR